MVLRKLSARLKQYDAKANKPRFIHASYKFRDWLRLPFPSPTWAQPGRAVSLLAALTFFDDRACFLKIAYGACCWRNKQAMMRTQNDAPRSHAGVISRCSKDQEDGAA